MPVITGFSPAVYQAVRAFYAAHPAYRLVQHREIETVSPQVTIASGRCSACGFEPPLHDALRGRTWPAGLLRAVTIYHDWRPDRSGQCGGVIEFTLEP